MLINLFTPQLSAGGAAKCNPISITAFTTLLAAAGPCEQQDAADSMIDLAKSLNNDPTMIKLSQIFAQQPRNTVSVIMMLCILYAVLPHAYIYGFRSPTLRPFLIVKMLPRMPSSMVFSSANSKVLIKRHLLEAS